MAADVIPIRPHDRRVDDRLDTRERRVCRALRSSARAVAAAGLPAEYRGRAFDLVAELELDRLEAPGADAA